MIFQRRGAERRIPTSMTPGAEQRREASVTGAECSYVKDFETSDFEWGLVPRSRSPSPRPLVPREVVRFLRCPPLVCSEHCGRTWKPFGVEVRLPGPGASLGQRVLSIPEPRLDTALDSDGGGTVFRFWGAEAGGEKGGVAFCL